MNLVTELFTQLEKATPFTFVLELNCSLLRSVGKREDNIGRNNGLGLDLSGCW